MRKKFIYDFPRPMAAVDMVLFSVAGQKLRVLLIRRGKKPYPGSWAFPGGFVEMEEDLPDAAARELAEETGLKEIDLEFFGTYGAPGRDPRGRVITSVFMGVVPAERASVQAGDDAADALWHSPFDPPHLAFDHEAILKDALANLKEGVLFDDLAFRFLPSHFAPDALKQVFDAVLKKRIPSDRFNAEMKRLGLLKDVPGNLKRLCRKTLGKLKRESGLFHF
ncbi:MAG: NUDIX domain-containing protein [Planctomycetota bacterium]|jgi:8-oxo-dGTP diphosphatase